MMSNNLDSVKVIDFSYSTPLNKDKFEKFPEFLKAFLNGTKQFMAPEQWNEDKVPITHDFSKMDVWALGVTLVHMITLTLPFANGGKTILQDIETYQSFIESPRSYLETHNSDV